MPPIILLYLANYILAITTVFLKIDIVTEYSIYEYVISS